MDIDPEVANLEPLPPITQRLRDLRPSQVRPSRRQAADAVEEKRHTIQKDRKRGRERWQRRVLTLCFAMNNRNCKGQRYVKDEILTFALTADYC